MIPNVMQNQIAGAKRVIVAGMGGGYDVVCAIPLFFALEALGYEVHFANFSSTPLNDVQSAQWHSASLLEVTANSNRPSYFPEAWLAGWFRAKHQRDVSVWCFSATGVGPYYKSYQYLVDHLQIDAVIAVDGGVDSLLRGDEYSLASPLEDALTLATINLLNVEKKFLVTTALGAERLDRISHAQIFARISDLTAAQAFYGASALVGQSNEGTEFIDAAQFILANQMGMHQSVVVASLLSALRGEFGDQVVNAVTQRTPVWVSPLMALYWYFDLGEVARQNLYLSSLVQTETFTDAAERLGKFVKSRPKRGWESIPI